MCIAVYKPAKAKVPSEETLHECWWGNSQGAGFAWFDKETQLWTINKGFMEWVDYIKAFDEANKKYDFESRCMMTHFRISTSGLLNGKGCTHPFPLTDDQEKIMATEITTPNLVMHNGVVGAGKGDYSDTQVSILEDIDALVPLLQTDDRIYDVLHRVLKADSCRWMVALGDDIWTWGTWIVEDEVYYSNNGYKITEKTYTKHQAGKPRPKVTYSAKHKKNKSRAGNVITYPGVSPLDNISDLPGARATSIPVMAMKEHECDLIEVPNKDVHLMLCDDGSIDWTGWTNYCINLASQPDGDDDTNNYPDVDKIIEVYDEDKKLICLVDTEEGEVVWDQDTQDRALDSYLIESELPLLATCSKCSFSQIDYEYESSDGYCPECGTFLAISEVQEDNIIYKCSACFIEIDCEDLLTDDACPMCGEKCYRKVKGTPLNDTIIVCPHCDEPRHLIESTESVGDSECCRCGAIWDSKDHNPRVIMYQQDVHEIWKQRESLKIMGDK